MEQKKRVYTFGNGKAEGNSITLPESVKDSQILLYGTNGQKVGEWKTDSQNIDINVSNLPDGTYPIIGIQNDVVSYNMLIMKH